MIGRYLVWLSRVLGVVLVAWLARSFLQPISKPPAAPSNLRLATPRRTEGQYDIRRGAAGYAPIIGLFGSLAVPAIVVVFTVSPRPGAEGDGTLIIFATGLLVIGMFGSLAGAIGLAAIGAERDPTANLAPAVMLIAIPAALSITAVLGAFDVLARLYIPQSTTTIFTWITAAGGAFGVVFNGYAASDSPGLGPRDPQEHERWLKSQWLKDRATAYRWGGLIGSLSLVPIIAGLIAVFGPHWRLPLNSFSVNAVIGAGILLSLAGTFLSVRRTAHPITGSQKGLRPLEAFGSNLTISFYITALILCLP